MKKYDQVYFIDKDNAPHPHTIIENTVYECNGYRLTHFSMGAGTSGNPERYHHLAIYSCNIGKVHIQVHEKNKPTTEIVLEHGEYWLRPCHTLCGWYCEEDTVFSVISLRFQANLIEDAVMGGKCTIRHLQDAKERVVNIKHIVNDERFTMDFVSMGKNSRYEIHEDEDVMFSVQYGKCALMLQKRNLTMEANQSFHAYKHGKAVIVTATHTKLIVLKFKHDD